jgi:AcrR family transcriptional regulator
MNGSRKEREREGRRQEILAAAKAIFAKKGFDGAVLDEIAARAEFSKATLYLYFKDKHDLFYAVLEDGLDKLLMRVKEIGGRELSPLARLEQMVRGVMAYMEEDRDFFRVLTPERAGMTESRHPDLKERVLPKLDAFVDLAASVIEEGIRGGKVKKLDPRAAADILFGMIQSAVVWWLLDGAKEPLALKSDLIIDILLSGIQVRKGRR